MAHYLVQDKTTNKGWRQNLWKEISVQNLLRGLVLHTALVL